MGEEKGIKNTQEVADFVVSMANAVLKAEADGKFDASDLTQLIAVFPTIAPAFEGMGEIPGELKDLSTEEAALIVTAVMTKLALDEPKARLTIEKGFQLVVASYEFYLAIKALKA